MIKALNVNNFSSSRFGHILQDINSVSSSFQNYIFCHTRRQGNRVAQGLARLANLSSNFKVWMEDVLLDIANVYIYEIT